MNRRIVAWFLAIFAFCLFCCGPMCQSANAIAGVDDVIISIIIAALAAMGVTFVVQGSFSSTQEYVSSLMEQYASERGVTVAQQLRGASTGVNSSGKLLLNNRLVAYIDGFLIWLTSKLGLINNSRKTVQVAGYAFGEITIYYSDSSISQDVQWDRNWKDIYTFNQPVLLVLTTTNTSSIGLYAVTNNYDEVSYRYRMIRISDNLVGEDKNLTASLSKTGNLYGITVDSDKYWGQINAYNGQISVYSGLTINAYSDFAAVLNNGNVNITNQSQIDAVTGVINPPSSDADYEQGDGAVLDLDAVWGMSYDDVTDSIPNDFGDDQEGEASIEYASEQEVIDQVEQTIYDSVSDNPEEYQVIGLQDVFPFCIPFDIYDFFECLAADPVAPVVNWRFYVPGICDETITLDLSQFNTVAQIVRTMELLAFIVGLALVTREKFLRG